MSKPKGSLRLADVQQHIQNLEVGLAMRLDDLGARIERIESDLAIIKEHLVTKMRASERKPESDP